MNTLICGAGLLAFILFAAETAFAAPRFQVVRSLIGHSYTEPTGISGDGRVVVGFSLDQEGMDRPFRQMQPGKPKEIPVPSPLHSEAWGVSGDGSVVVGNTYNAAVLQRGFRWTKETGTVDLSPDPNLSTSSLGVSGDGRIVVGSFTDNDPNSTEQPFRWSTKAGFQPLDNVDGQGGFASAANADGSVIVGGITMDRGLRHACRWVFDGHPELLGDLGEESYGIAVTPDGSVIVGSASGLDQVQHAYRWTAKAGMQLLDSDLTVLLSAAIGVSADGNRIVGNIALPPDVQTYQTAFLWTPEGGLQQMDQLFRSLLPHGWTFISAAAISADGRWIVGTTLSPERGLLGYILDTGRPRQAPGELEKAAR